ncbi:MAG: response regulator, partial [Sulfurimonadaceae bacterium]|nr:response regulator [Sulfurimonadaceae bacterium]
AIGVFNYLKKPFSVDDMVAVLLRAVEAIESDENRDLFSVYMHDILNYQSNLLLLMHDEKPLFANQSFLDFFQVDTLDQFVQEYGDLGKLLEEHKGFLFNQSEIGWFENAVLNPDKLFHTKIRNKKRESYHFILKLHPVPDKADHYILSLNDVSELKLLALFDAKADQHDQELKNKAKVLNMFDVVRQNSAKIKVLNFYKGLTIANDAVVVEVNDDDVVIKTNFMQQKAIQLQKNMVVTSEAFPMDIACSSILGVDFESQTVRFQGAVFTERSPSARKNVRVVPEENHTVSLFYMDRKYFGESRILDISVSAVKIQLDALPAGMDRDESVIVDMVLPTAKAPLIVNCKAKVFRVEKNRYYYQIVLILEPGQESVKALTGYIAKRQMDLIREFKGMQIGK